MTPISSAVPSTVSPLTAAEKILGTPKVQRPEEEFQSGRLKPVMDEYVPEKPQEPSGRYWLGKDEDGQPKVYFDDPEVPADAPKQAADSSENPDRVPQDSDPEKEEGAEGPKGPKKEGAKEERCVGNTDEVDREIRKLKEKKKELEQRINTETDEAKIRELEKKLGQVERELSEKDNDNYRRQHSKFTQLS